MKIALFAAFPQELKYIRNDAVTLTKSQDYPYQIFLNTYKACDIIAVETGMSTANIQAAFKHVLAAYRPDIILSIGFGGALYYKVDIGELVLASRYFSMTREGVIELPRLFSGHANSGRSLNCGALLTKLQQRILIKEGSSVTLSAWMAKSKLKACMPGDAAFPVCDRETIHLAKMSHNNNLPFFAIRSITDTLDQDIPEELFGVIDGNGNYRLSRALGLLISRPFLIPDSIRLGRNAALASKNLWEAVKAFVEALPGPIPDDRGSEKYIFPQRTHWTLRNE